MPHANKIWLLLAVVTFLIAPQASVARVNVVTLPGRDSVQLTIYNSVDLTMVKETRRLTFRKGMNHLEFSWANTLIDATSVEFKALTHPDEVEVLDVRFPPRVSNTLEWHVQSEVSGEVEIEISYFTSGVSWSADYMAEVAQDERSMKLNGEVKVTNLSGEDYENAQVRLVVGVIRLVEEIRALSIKNSGGIVKGALAWSKTVELDSLSDRLEPALTRGFREEVGKEKQVTKEGLSEYFLYTVEGRDTIPNGWAKKLPSFSAPQVALASLYKYEKEQFGDQVNRFYTFTNSLAGHLGTEPLPDGVLHAFRLAAPDASYAYQGASSFKYIPLNEKAELDLGSDGEVQIRPRMISWQKQELRFDNNGDIAGWTTRESWEIELQNSKPLAVTADVRRAFDGDWTLTSASTHENMDARKVRFLVPLPAHSRQTVSYQLTTHHGANATR